MKLYSNVTIIFIIWLISLIFISYFGFLYFPHAPKSNPDFLTSFSNWDGGHYLGIAEAGYSERNKYAFFPLYPILISLFNKITNNLFLAAILISLLSFFLGLHLLYALITKDFDKKIAEKVILALIFFPTAFYFMTVYSEGLFFLLVVSTFYFLRSNKIFFATVAALLASATRVAGIAVVFALIAYVYTTGGINRKNWFVLLSPLGFLAYSIFLYYQTSDPFYFITAEKNWQRDLSLPWFGFWNALENITTPGFITHYFMTVLDLLFAIFGVGFVIRSFRFLPPQYSIYALISIILPLLTSTLSSIPRFLLVIFPIFILIALVKNKFLTLAYQVISLMLLSLFIVLFVNGFWVS